MPSNLSVADIKTTPNREKKGGKVSKKRLDANDIILLLFFQVAKQRKQRKSGKKTDNNKRFDNSEQRKFESSYVPATPFIENNT